MNQADFYDFAVHIFGSDVLPLLAAKGPEYTGKNEPTLKNWDDAAVIMGTNTRQEIFSAATKHWLAIARSVTGRTHPSKEVIESRIRDVIIYMLLLMYSLFKEGR